MKNAQAKLQCNSAIEPSAALWKHDWAWSFFCCNALQEYTVVVHVAIRYDCPCEDPCYCTGQMSFVSQAGIDSSCTSLKTLDVWMQFCVNFLCMSNWTLCCGEAPSAGLTTSSTGRIILPDTTAPTLTLYECVPWRVLPKDCQNKGNEGVAFFKAKIFFIIFHLRDRLATWIPSCDSLDMWRRLSFRYQHGNFWCTWCDFVWIWFSVARTRVILIRWLPCALHVYHLTIQIQQPRSINDLHQINIFVTNFSSQVFAKDPAPQALDPPRTCLRNGDAAQHRYWRIRILEMKRVCLKASSLSSVKEKKYLKDMKRSKELHTWPTWPTWSVYRYSTRISLRREEHH